MTVSISAAVGLGLVKLAPIPFPGEPTLNHLEIHSEGKVMALLLNMPLPNNHESCKEPLTQVLKTPETLPPNRKG